MLLQIAELLSHPDVNKRFRKGATYRFKRMFDDEKQLWKRVAREHHVLMEDAKVRTGLRKMYQSKDTRPEWTALMDDLGVEEANRGQFK